MPKNIYTRLGVAGVIFILYFVSVFLLSVIPWKSWSTLLLGLFLGSIGVTCTHLLLRQWELNLRQNITRSFRRTYMPPTPEEPESSTDSPENLPEILSDLESKTEALQELEKEKNLFEHRIEDVTHEFSQYKVETEEEIRRKAVLLSEYQETINQQREVIQKKQEQISELESKIRDLNYEVKTLLQLADMGNYQNSSKEEKESSHVVPEPHHQVSPNEKNRLVKTPAEATSQLNRCIDIAQKMTGGNHFGNGNSRFRDFSMNNYALDLRRLFDSLRSETSSPVLVYSQKENQLLFANQQIKNLLGWNPEKFIHQFSDIIQEGAKDWNNGLSQLSSDKETKVRMLMKTKSGQNLLVHCHLGMIPRGIFRNHIVGVLYPA